MAARKRASLGDGDIPAKKQTVMVKPIEERASHPTCTTTARGISMDEVDKVLLAPYRHICETIKADSRSKMAEAFNYWLQIPDDVMKMIGDATKLLHNGSLLIDDIKDNSTLRRGVPAAHVVYGIPQTITCANYIYVLLLQKVQLLPCPDAGTVLTEQIQKLFQGDSMEIHWRDTGRCPSEEQYTTMAIAKRGAMFELIVRLMQLFSSNKSDFKPFIDNFGLFYQIRNDYINIWSTEYVKNTSYCEDLTEGKFSFPIIHAIQADTQDSRVLNILNQRTSDMDMKQYCVQLLEKKGSFEYTKSKLMTLEDRMREQIDAYGGNPRLSAIIDALREVYSE